MSLTVTEGGIDGERTIYDQMDFGQNVGIFLKNRTEQETVYEPYE
jgi:hypothetical protein